MFKPLLRSEIFNLEKNDSDRQGVMSLACFLTLNIQSMRYIYIILLSLIAIQTQAQDTYTETVDLGFDEMQAYTEQEAISQGLNALLSALSKENLDKQNVDCQWNAIMYIKVQKVGDDRYRLDINEVYTYWTLDQLHRILSDGLKDEAPKTE